MYLFRAISRDEYELLRSGKSIRSDRDFSIYYRGTTTKGLSFFKVDSINDDEIFVKDCDRMNVRLAVNIDTLLQRVPGYSKYAYNVILEVPDDFGNKSHGSYVLSRETVVAPERWSSFYNMNMVKRIIERGTEKVVYSK